MTNLEKLAREICWREFSAPRTARRIGHTKAGYWRDHVCAEKKKEYIADAEWLMWCMKNMPTDMLASDYCN